MLASVPHIRSTLAVTALLLAAALVAGCVSGPPLLPGELGEGSRPSIELTSTPFFPQKVHQCGPAALATALAASGVAVSADDLVDRVYLPRGHGSLQTELVAAARGYDRLPYRIDPRMSAIGAELAAARPVLVLQNLGVKLLPVWHYAVIVGYDSARDVVVLRSGTQQRLEMRTRRFLDSWQRADRWGLVLVHPGEVPVAAVQDRYLESAAGLEAAGRYAAATEAYQAALRQWPSSTTAMLGLGNVHYRQKQLDSALADYRRVLDIEPEHAVARNNLAQVLLDQGQPEAALREITTARASLKDARFAPLLEQTDTEIRRALAERKAQADRP